MDFENPKAYGDTSISDGLVVYSPPIYLPVNRTATPHHDKSTLITGSTGSVPIVFEWKLCATWDYLKYLFHHRWNQMLSLSTQTTLYGNSLFTISPVLLLSPPRMIMSSSPSTTTAAWEYLSWLKRKMFLSLDDVTIVWNFSRSSRRRYCPMYL